MNGFINILKPPGMTSHDVVYFIRKITGIKKVGHTGTLDPEAAGVLPLCVGKATRAAQYVVDRNKTYRANIKFGITTDTQDKYGNVLNKVSVPDISIADFKRATNKFIGLITQIPPLYSAVKHKGKRLYQYAHEGESPTIKGRQVRIYGIKIIKKVNYDEFIFDITCSKGTYIRTLCHDIGIESGYGAHMSQLIRLNSFPFDIKDTYTIEDIKLAVSKGNLNSYIIGIDKVLFDYDKISINNKFEKAALNGNVIYSDGTEEDLQKYEINKELRLYINECFIGVGIVHYDEKNKNNYLKIKTLFV